MRSGLLLVLCGVASAQQAPSLPPSPPPSPPAPPSNTSVSFFNIGACSTVPSVKFSFEDSERSGSAGLLSCPPEFLVPGTSTCHVPGPYGREVFVTLKGDVHFLDITILNPSNDDEVLRPATRVYLSVSQRRNHVGAAVATSVLPSACAGAFELIDEAGSGDIAPGYFRSIFRHAALGLGSARIVSNDDATIDTIEPGESITLDQRLLSASDLPAPVLISFVRASGGASASSTPTDPTEPAKERLWGQTCERASTAFMLFGSPSDGLPLRVLRLDGAGLTRCDYSDAATLKFDAELALYNAVPRERGYAFAFGVSPFMPYESTSKSGALAYKEASTYSVRQPGEVFVKVLD